MLYATKQRLIGQQYGFSSLGLDFTRYFGKMRINKETHKVKTKTKLTQLISNEKKKQQQKSKLLTEKITGSSQKINILVEQYFRMVTRLRAYAFTQ